jgi:CRISPR/Cas system-associated exonuclease Cas4 (RecB family)
MDPTRGTIVHRVLETFFAAEKTKGRRSAEPWNQRHTLLAILEQEIQRAGARGQVGLPIFHAHDLATLRADLERFLKEDSAHRLTAGARPEEFEGRFDGVTIGGRAFRGSADRVDGSPDGTRAWIIDYKTGRSDGYETTGDDPFKGGRQLSWIYAAAFAAQHETAVTGRYWFITQRGEFDSIEYQHSRANAQRLEEVVQAMESGVAAGVFPAVPGEETPWGFENCRYCDFDRLCSRRRLAQFTMRAGDASVGPWTRIETVAKGSPDA